MLFKQRAANFGLSQRWVPYYFTMQKGGALLVYYESKEEAEVGRAAVGAFHIAESKVELPFAES